MSFWASAKNLLPQPPLCKGRWHGLPWRRGCQKRRDCHSERSEESRISNYALNFTILPSRLTACHPPLHKEGFSVLLRLSVRISNYALRITNYALCIKNYAFLYIIIWLYLLNSRFARVKAFILIFKTVKMLFKQNLLTYFKNICYTHLTKNIHRGIII